MDTAVSVAEFIISLTFIDKLVISVAIVALFMLFTHIDQIVEHPSSETHAGVFAIAGGFVIFGICYYSQTPTPWRVRCAEIIAVLASFSLGIRLIYIDWKRRKWYKEHHGPSSAQTVQYEFINEPASSNDDIIEGEYRINGTNLTTRSNNSIRRR